MGHIFIRGSAVIYLITERFITSTSDSINVAEVKTEAYPSQEKAFEKKNDMKKRNEKDGQRIRPSESVKTGTTAIPVHHKAEKTSVHHTSKTRNIPIP